MPPKKRPTPRVMPAQAGILKGPAPRRPTGVQSLGPVRYEALRRALHALDAAVVER